MNQVKIDVAINIFAKPYQTSLSLLSLLKFSGQHIDKIYMQFEPLGSNYDYVLPYVIAEYLEEKAVVFQPVHWLGIAPTDFSRFDDAAYRLSVRYQHAFENTEKKYLYVTHNDILVKKDIIGALLAEVGDAFIIGDMGQCWNCPAAKADLVKAAGLGDAPCSKVQYDKFQPDFKGLERLYQEAEKAGIFVRAYLKGLSARYSSQAWPLPECRVNEWACLVDMEATRPKTIPHGPITPFGAFEFCGDVALDTSVPWFRDLNRLGMRAKHMEIYEFITHWVGSDKMTRRKYVEAEENAKRILEKAFRPFVEWCRKKNNGMFPA